MCYFTLFVNTPDSPMYEFSFKFLYCDSMGCCCWISVFLLLLPSCSVSLTLLWFLVVKYLFIFFSFFCSLSFNSPSTSFILTAFYLSHTLPFTILPVHTIIFRYHVCKADKKNTQTFFSLSLVSFVFAFISCLLRVVFRLSCSDSYIRFSFAGNVEVDRVVAAGMTGLLLNFEYNRSDFYQRLNKSCVQKFDKWKHRLAVLTFNRCRTLPFFVVSRQFSMQQNINNNNVIGVNWFGFNKIATHSIYEHFYTAPAYNEHELKIANVRQINTQMCTKHIFNRWVWCFFFYFFSAATEQLISE